MSESMSNTPNTIKTGWKFDNAADLMGREIPPQKWIISNMLPEGLTLLCGAPKIGKSWLALDMALHVASGTSFWDHYTRRGKVVLFALEDGERRMKERIWKLACNREDLQGGFENLEINYHVPPLDSGFASGLDSALSNFGGGESVSLVVIDTLGKIREPSNREGYQRDYAQIAALKSVADKHHIALLVVHHLRKASAEDPFDEISGTNGIYGAADGAYVLKRNTRTDKNAKLYGASRDSYDQQHAIMFDDDCRWKHLSDDAEQYEFENSPLAKYLKQVQTPLVEYPKAIAADYMLWCKANNLAHGLPLTNSFIALGRKLTDIKDELPRLGLTYNERRTSKGNLITIDRVHD